MDRGAFLRRLWGLPLGVVALSGESNLENQTVQGSLVIKGDKVVVQNCTFLGITDGPAISVDPQA